MHSRIIQLSKDKISKDDYICANNYYESWFLSIMDYVSDDTDRVSDIAWFRDCLNDKGIKFYKDDNGEFIVITDKEKYFGDNVISVQKAAEKLRTITVSQLATTELEMVIYNLKEAYEDKYGFYVDFDGELQTLDKFVRRSKNGDKCYIGATVDYHF